MLRGRAHIGFPVPAALAFLAFRPGDSDGWVAAAGISSCETFRSSRSDSSGFAPGPRGGRADESELGFERFADGLGLPGFLQLRQGQLAQLEQGLPGFAFGVSAMKIRGAQVSDGPNSRCVPGTNSQASSAVKARIGASIWQKP